MYSSLFQEEDGDRRTDLFSAQVFHRTLQDRRVADVVEVVGVGGQEVWDRQFSGIFHVAVGIACKINNAFVLLTTKTSPPTPPTTTVIIQLPS